MKTLVKMDLHIGLHVFDDRKQASMPSHIAKKICGGIVYHTSNQFFSENCNKSIHTTVFSRSNSVKKSIQIRLVRTIWHSH